MREDVRQDKFRCDYCGSLSALHEGRIFWEWTESLDDGSDRYTPAVYCSDYCGHAQTAGAVGSGHG